MTWSVNIYLDGGLGTSNIKVDSNFLYSTDTTFYRNGLPASGIYMCVINFLLF